MTPYSMTGPAVAYLFWAFGALMCAVNAAAAGLWWLAILVMAVAFIFARCAAKEMD
jgi:hypothetical protein